MPLVPVYPIDTMPVCSHRYRMVAYFIYMFISITAPLDNIFIISNWRLLWTWPDDNMLGSDGITRWHVYIFLLLIICLLYGITNTTSCIIYYYRVCITIVYITSSFILPLTRSLSDDPGFACPGWRSELSFWSESPYGSHRRLIIETIHRYLCALFLLSPLFLYFYLLWSLTPFCRYSCTHFLLEPLCLWRWFPVLRLNVRVSLFSPRVCTSP